MSSLFMIMCWKIISVRKLTVYSYLQNGPQFPGPIPAPTMGPSGNETDESSDESQSKEDMDIEKTDEGLQSSQSDKVFNDICTLFP